METSDGGVEHLRALQSIYTRDNKLKTFGTTVKFKNGIMLRSSPPTWPHDLYSAPICSGQNAIALRLNTNRLLALEIHLPGELERLTDYLDVKVPRTWTLCNGDGIKVLFFKDYYQPKTQRSLLPFKVECRRGIGNSYVLPNTFDYDGPEIQWDTLHSPFTMPDPAPTPNWLKVALGCSFIDLPKSEDR